MTEDREPHRLLAALAHRFKLLAIALAALTGAVVVNPGSGVVGRFFITMWMVTMLASIASQHHAHVLCSRCLVPAMPGLIGDRDNRRLRRWHWFRSKRNNVVIILVLVGYAVCILVVLPAAHFSERGTTRITAAGIALILLEQAWQNLLNQTHSQLLLWCPYCRHRGKAAHPVPEPVPDPTGSSS